MKRFMTAILASLPIAAQDVVPVRAGLVHLVEGEVYLDGTRLNQEKSPAKLPWMRNGQSLRTADGQAELLLSPGTVLRVASGSEVKMLSNELTDTRVELLSGSLILEILGMAKENAIALHYREATVVPRGTGLYRLGGSMAELLVYDGRADVLLGGKKRTLKRGRGTVVDNWKMARSFDPRKGDGFLVWSVARSQKLAQSAATSVQALVGRRSPPFGWMWDPRFAMYTFIPRTGAYCGFFSSYCFYSPVAYYDTFIAPPVRAPETTPGGGFDSSGSYPTVSQRTYESPSAPASAPAAATAPEPVRSTEGAAGRGGEGGGRSQ
ncbi:MAG: FecR domain-containing protein [Acidobacteria bacterium]|nr:FecR domain-containing protein [Acidobacteriota bacterium]